MRERAESYSWQCVNKCLPPIDTGVALSEDLTPFEQVGLKDGQIVTPLFTRPLPSSLVPGAKVYMPFILFHFIECTRGACYNSIFSNLLLLHLDNVAVLDYVLRSSVVHGDAKVVDGVSKPKMYGELHSRLKGVKSSTIHKYLADTFGEAR